MLSGGAHFTAAATHASVSDSPSSTDVEVGWFCLLYTSDACRPFLQREVALLAKLSVVVCLGGFAYEAACSEFGVRPRPKFGHGVEATAPNGLTLVCSYHPSQQNTFTGRLTEPMLDSVFSRAVALLGRAG